MTADAPYQLDTSSEYAFIVAIFRQARKDLRAAAPSQERAVSIQFFCNQYRHFEMLCDLVGLDYEPLQEAILAEYPHLF